MRRPRHCEKLPADYPDRGGCLGRARLGQGRIGEAIQILETVQSRRLGGIVRFAAILATPMRGPAAARRLRNLQPLLLR